MSKFHFLGIPTEPKDDEDDDDDDDDGEGLFCRQDLDILVSVIAAPISIQYRSSVDELSLQPHTK